MTSAFWKIHTYIDINVVCQNINFLWNMQTHTAFLWLKEEICQWFWSSLWNTSPVTRTEWKDLSCSLKNCKTLEMFHIVHLSTLWKSSTTRNQLSCHWFYAAKQFDSCDLKKKIFLFKVFDFLSILPKILKWKINTTYKTLISLFWKSFKNETNKFL